MNKLTPIAAALLLISGVANATTFSAPSATPNPATLSGGSATVNFNIPLSHADNVPGSCGLQLDYGDGSAPEQFLAQVTETSISRTHAYTKAGIFNATLSPVSMLNPAGAMRPACSGGSVGTQVTVAKAAVTGVPKVISKVTLQNDKPQLIPYGVGGYSSTIQVVLELQTSGLSGSCQLKADWGGGIIQALRVNPGDSHSLGFSHGVSMPGNYTVTVKGAGDNEVPACGDGPVSLTATVLPANTGNGRAAILGLHVSGQARYEYTYARARASWSLDGIDFQKGEPCDYKIQWEIGGNSQVFSMHYAGQGAVTGRGGSPMLGAFEAQRSVAFDPAASHAPTMADTATVTIKGFGSNACNGNISRSLKLPLPTWAPVSLGQSVAQ